MRKSVLAIALLALAVIMLSVAPTMSSKETVGPFSTWDADMVNADTAHQMGYSGQGVYVAVLDTGLVPYWNEYFPTERIAIELGKGFKENVIWDQATQSFIESGVVYETSYIGDTGSTHGTHVTSTIIGYNYYAPQDAAAGLPLSPIFVQGIAPNVTIIPVKVLSDYYIGQSHLSADFPDRHLVFGTDRAVAAGIKYATDLKIAGYSPMVITMSLGGSAPSTVMEDAIDYAIENGVLVVAAAGNEGNQGMSWPGAYPQVISVGANGWEYEWYWGNHVAPPPRNRLWWLQSSYYAYNDIPDPTPASEVYITDFSSREGPGQQLDVVAPGSWVRGPFPGIPGYRHVPWFSEGLPYFVGDFFFAGGTSMATPHVAAILAMMLEKDSNLTQTAAENILKSTALFIPPGSMTIWDLTPTQGFYTRTWGSNATGSGLVQADLALIATP